MLIIKVEGLYEAKMHNGVEHSLPVGDLEAHTMEETCHCQPSLVSIDGKCMVVVHHPFDKRDYFDAIPSIAESYKNTVASGYQIREMRRDLEKTLLSYVGKGVITRKDLRDRLLGFDTTVQRHLPFN